MSFVTNIVAKTVVKGRIKTIAHKAGISPDKVYAVIDAYKEDGSFRIWLYSKDDLTKPIREVSLEELL